MNSAELARGIAHFNRAEFFEAHEILEDIWRIAPAEQKKYFQGLVQTAVGFHHFSTGNQTGMRSVLERALRNLDGCPAQFHGINIRSLVDSVNDWLTVLDRGQSNRPPHIEMVVTHP